jgi:formylglycine-generating enzyme
MRWVVALLAGIGCSEGEDSGRALDPDTAATTDACMGEAGGGTVQGEADCRDGVCLVPAGVAWLGAATPDHPDACPPREVELSTFRIGETEVTGDAYKACAEAGACTDVDDACPRDPVEVPSDAPATCVSYSQAQAYCAWVGGRLPTEAEWEKAARGTDGARFPWGAEAPDCQSANFRYVAAYCVGDVTRVGRYPTASAFGLVDTSGNAWEWTADWYDAEWPREAPRVDPPGPETTCRDVVGGAPAECRARALRGGAYNTTEYTIEAHSRSFAEPQTVDDNIGLRCAWDGGW